MSYKSTRLAPDDRALLNEDHEFVRDDERDEEQKADWKIRMSRNYYDKLFKEFAIIDLSRYESGEVGMRWRTEREVIDGKGQYICGARKCDSNGLKSFEVPFKYEEKGIKKIELVKVRLCPDCERKLQISESVKKGIKSQADHRPLSDSSFDRPSRAERSKDESDNHRILKKQKIG